MLATGKVGRVISDAGTRDLHSAFMHLTGMSMSPGELAS
jgi:hypothetical protein